jgi:HK97 family phage prohead protease
VRDLIEIDGYCTSWRPFHLGDDQLQWKFAPTAFDAFLQTRLSKVLPVYMQHEERLRLPRFGEVKLQATGAGLRFRCSLLRTSISEDLELALLNSKFGGMSVCWTTEQREFRHGCKVITRAKLHEISITDDPRIPGTSLRLASKPPAGRWPEFNRLQTFLRKCDHKPMLPSRSMAKSQPAARREKYVPVQPMSELIATGRVVVADVRAAAGVPLLTY